MFFKKKKTEKGKEYFGEDILLQDIPRQIFGEIAHFTYDVELKRQESILTQSSNMLVFISLISAAFCTILPSAFSLFEKQKIELLVLCCISALISILLLSSLIIILLAQWRFSYKTTPNIIEVKRCLEKANNDYKIENLSAEYVENSVPEMLITLKEENDLRCKFVIASMILMLMTLVVFIASIFVVLVLYWRLK